MFISKSSTVIDRYFSEVFDWLKKCESIFGFNLKDTIGSGCIPFWLKDFFLTGLKNIQTL